MDNPGFEMNGERIQSPSNERDQRKHVIPVSFSYSVARTLSRELIILWGPNSCFILGKIICI